MQRLRLRYKLAADVGILIAVAAGVSVSNAFARLATLIFFAVAFVLVVMGS